MSNIYHKNYRGWQIYTNGTMFSLKEKHYVVDGERLYESDWVYHLTHNKHNYQNRFGTTEDILAVFTEAIRIRKEWERKQREKKRKKRS